MKETLADDKHCRERHREQLRQKNQERSVDECTGPLLMLQIFFYLGEGQKGKLVKAQNFVLKIGKKEFSTIAFNILTNSHWEGDECDVLFYFQFLTFSFLLPFSPRVVFSTADC